jgi:hypothetical protein
MQGEHIVILAEIQSITTEDSKKSRIDRDSAGRNMSFFGWKKHQKIPE